MTKAKNLHTSLKWPLPDVGEVVDLEDLIEIQNPP